jgi:hypothetical protein
MKRVNRKKVSKKKSQSLVLIRKPEKSALGQPKLVKKNKFWVNDIGNDVLVPVYTAPECRTLALNGLGLIDTRLYQLFRFYEFWQVNKLTFTYKPIVSALTDGNIAISPDYDISDDIPAYAEALNILSKNMDYVVTPLGKQASVAMENPIIKGDKMIPKLYTAPTITERLSSFGQLIYCTQGYSLAADTIVGHIYVHWDIDFFVPQFNTPPGVTADLAYIKLDPASTYLPTGEAMHDKIALTAAELARNLGFNAYLSDPSPAPINGQAGAILTGKLAYVGNGSLKDGAGLSIKEGTRLFVKYCTQAWDSATTNLFAESTTSALASISLDPAGLIPAYVTATAAAYAISLIDLMSFVPLS